MKIVLAPDSYKDALSAAAARAAMAEGVRRVVPKAELPGVPVADGGEGFVEAMLGTAGATRKTATVTGPLGDRGEKVGAAWAMLGDVGGGWVGVVELAQAAGLELVGEGDRDPMRTTTFGVGELIAAALDAGAATVLLGVGGSATNDAGCGMAQALGVRFFDGGGALIETAMTGGDLLRVERIDLTGLDAQLTAGVIGVACDVTNPLHGPTGAAHVYAKQKGATPAQIEALDAGLRHIESVWRRSGAAVCAGEGFGAAGGTAGGAVCMLGAALQGGAELVLEAVGFDAAAAGADLVLTGEGRLDGQSLSGKAVLAVAGRARKQGVSTIALVGSAAADAGRCVEAGLAGYEVLAAGLPAAESIARTAELLADAAERVVRDFMK